jgi:hypothetical protein
MFDESRIKPVVDLCDAEFAMDGGRYPHQLLL